MPIRPNAGVRALTVAGEMYIKRVLLALEEFLFFSHYLLTGIARQLTTLKQLRLRSRHDSLGTNIEPFILFSDITFALPISPTPDAACYTWPLRESPKFLHHDLGVHL